MSEKERHPSFTRIYDIVARGDPDIAADLQVVEVFLKQVAKEAKKPRVERQKLEEPSALDNPVFTRVFRELGSKLPLVVLRNAIEEDERREEQRKKADEARALTPRPIPRIIPSSSSPHNTEYTPGQRRTDEDASGEQIIFKPRAKEDSSTIAPAGYLSPDEVAERVNRTVRYVRSRLVSFEGKKQIGKYVFYPEEAALQMFKRKESTQKRRRSKKREPFVLPEGYHSRKELQAMFPQIYKTHLSSELTGIPFIRKGAAKYYLLEDVQSSLSRRWRSSNQGELNNAEWASFDSLQLTTGVPVHLLKRILRDVPHKDKKWHRETSLNLIARYKQIHDPTRKLVFSSPLEIMKPKKARKIKGQLPGKEIQFLAPENYVTELSLHQSFPEVPLPQLRAFFKGLPVGTNMQNTEKYFPEAKVVPKIKEYLQHNPPKVQEQIVKDNVMYESINKLQENGVDLSGSVLRNLFKDLSGILGKGKNGKACTLYPADEARALISQYEEQKRINEEKRKSAQVTRATAKTLGNEYGIPVRVVMSLLEDVSKERKRQVSYDREESEPLLLDYLRKRPDNAGVYLRQGKMWAPLHYYNKRFNVGYDKLREEFTSVSTTKGFGGTLLYEYSEAIKKLDPYIQAPQVDQKTGVYTDDKKEQWAPEAVICTMLKISHDKFHTYSEKAATKDIRDRKKALAVGYNISQIEKRAAAYLALPTIAPEPATTSIREKDKKALVSAQTLADQYKLPLPTVRKQLQQIGVSIRGSGRQKHYLEQQAHELLSAFKKRPKIDVKTEEYRDTEGDIYVTSTEGFRRVKGGRIYFDQVLKEGSVKKIDGVREHTTTTLYRLEDIIETKKKLLQQEKPPKPYKHGQTINKREGFTYWGEMKESERNALIEEKTRALIKAGMRLDATSLKQADAGLRKAVGKYYPGGITALREKLKVTDTVPTQRNWAKEKDPAKAIREEVKKQLKNNITSATLKEIGLWEAVKRVYPGGYEQIKKDLSSTNKRTSWQKLSVIERNALIEEKAKALSDDGMQISMKGLTGKHSAFRTAIARYYPNGFEGLREKLELTDTVKQYRKKWEDENKPVEVILSEVQELMATNEGDFTTQDLIRKGLLHPVYTYYPGGYDQLRIDLGLGKRGRWENK